MAGDDRVPVPRATYRLQFRKEFGFDDAAAIAGYLARLGVSHIYASPYLKARPGSTHGYDIVDHDLLNPELGEDSHYAGWFDIDWEPDPQYLRGKLLVPFLGDQYGEELERGSLELKFDAEQGSFAVWAYGTHKLPICPLHYQRILGNAPAALEQLGDAFAGLPEWRPQVARRASELKERLAALVAEDAEAAEQIRIALARFNG